MKIYDLINIFVGINETENFNICVIAEDEIQALDLAKEYGEDSGFADPDDWTIKPFDSSRKDINFDCDYAISEADIR